MKNRIVHFEIPIEDYKKAKDFYESAFDWELESMGDEGGMVYTTDVDKDQNPTELGGINGNFYKRTAKDQKPSLVVQTDSIDESVEKITKAGGKITTPKHEIGEWGFMADFSDPEGNELTLWENAKS